MIDRGDANSARAVAREFSSYFFFANLFFSFLARPLLGGNLYYMFSSSFFSLFLLLAANFSSLTLAHTYTPLALSLGSTKQTEDKNKKKLDPELTFYYQ